MKITGVGPVTPAGVGHEAFWQGILEPVSRVRAFRDLGDSFGPFVATVVEDFDLRRYVKSPGSLLGEARHTQFAVAAAGMAIAQAGIPEAELREMMSAIYIGSSLMDFGSINRTVNSVASKGGAGGFRRAVFAANVASISGAVAKAFGLQGQSIAPQSSCCSGLDAIGMAADAIASGEVDVAVCGGVEAPLYPTPLVELRSVNLTPPTEEQAEKICRPFDLWRTTGVVGEGGGILLLESEDSPREALAWITGYKSRIDREGLLTGLSESAIEALVEAGTRPDDVGAMSLWGPGHREIDKSEAQAMKRVFGGNLPLVPAVSLKGAIGNPLAAAGAIQVIAACLGLGHGVIPPTVNWEFPDPACPFALSNQARYLPHDTVLVNAHGLMGANSALVLGKNPK